MSKLKQLLSEATISTDGTDVRILASHIGERDVIFNELHSIQTGIHENPDQVILVKAVIIFDDEGNYFIHGTSQDDAEAMFKSMAGIWHFDPSKELVRQVELDLKLPKVASLTKAHVV